MRELKCDLTLDTACWGSRSCCLSLDCLQKVAPQQSTSAVGAPDMFNFVSKNVRDVNAREGLSFHCPSGHIPGCVSVVLTRRLHYWGLQTLFSAPCTLFHSSGCHWPLSGSGSVVVVSDLPAKFADVNQRSVDQRAAKYAARATSQPTCAHSLFSGAGIPASSFLQVFFAVAVHLWGLSLTLTRVL